MDRDGIRIERESCRAYVNMEQSCGVWKLQAQDPQLHVYFEKETKGVRLNFLLRLKDAEYFKAALYYKGAGEEFSEERVYPFLVFNSGDGKGNLFSLSCRSNTTGSGRRDSHG